MIPRCIRSLTVGLGLAVFVASGVSAAASPPSPLVPGDGLVASRSYGQWEAANWQYLFSQPDVTSNETSCFSTGQHGPVWFIAGSRGVPSVHTFACAIPAGRYMMLGGPSIYCSTIERPPFHATTNAGLMRCAKAQWRRHAGGENVTLDGVKIQPPGYIGGTPPFAFKMPDHNNVARLPGRTHGRAAVYGAATILRPLSPGTHILVQSGGYAHTSIAWTVTYHLTVG